MSETYYNHKKYLSFLDFRFDKSNTHYYKVFKNGENPEDYLHINEFMNVYPIYPRPIIMPLKKSKTTYNDVQFKKGSKLNINLKDEADQYGKDVSISVDTWKPDAETPKAAVNETSNDLPF